MSKPGRLIIADPGLTGAAGHHLSYSAAVGAAAERAGMPALVLAHRGFTGDLPGGVATRAVLGSAYQSAGGGGLARRLAFGLAARLPGALAGMVAPPLRALRRAMRGQAIDGLGAELAPALAELAAGAGDVLLLHSVSGANLHAVALAEGLGEVTLLVVLRRMPAEMEADDPAPGTLPALLQRLAARFGPRLRLFADTEGLASQFATLSGLPVRPVPLPIALHVPVARPPGQPPHVVFAGGARAEKGYHHLPAAIAAVAGRARFTIQSGPVGAEDDPLVQRAHRRLRGMEGAALGLIEAALPPAEYDAMLASADLLLLPYDGPTYGQRSSGILAESLALGIPAVVPAGCWMAEVGGEDRVVAVPHGAALGPYLAQALEHLPDLTAAARAAAPAWRKKHNPDVLFQRLMAPP